MVEILLHWLKNIPQEYAIVILAALPLAELRGAIPVALSLGMSLEKAFWLSVLGNAIPVIPILFFLEPVSNRLGKFKIFKRFFDWLFEHTRKKSDTIQKWETLGLAIFVAIPLPMTGAWSGAVAASLLKMKFRYALIGNLLGIMGAGIIVTVLSTLGIISWKALIQ